MPDQNLTLEPRLISALQSLRVALHVPEDLSGITSALSAASDCLNLAASHFYDQNLFEWKSVADDLRAAFSEQAATGSTDAARWYRPSSTDGTAQSRLATWRRSVSPGELELKLSILIGRTIAAAAAANARVSPALIEGANILRNTQRGKGRRSHTWNTLLTLDLLDGTGIAHLCESIDPRAVHFSFLSAALHVLRSPIYSPYRHIQEVETGASLDKSSIDSGLLSQPNDKETTDSDAATVPASEESPNKRDDLLPDIGSRLASSDYTSYSEKLGFVTRDYIDSDDLSLMTRQLVKHLESRNKPQSAFAALALVSLLTGCTDFLAMKLRFEPGHSIWLNIDCSVWCWAFSAYRSKQDDPNEPATGEPISVALPGNLALRLHHLRAAHQSASTLGEMITAELGSPLELDQFRAFLRTCGDAVHPPYASRFAKSMMFAYLHICGSDMAAAMLSGHFAVAAPAALFYYGPSYRLLQQRLNATYSFLGLGQPAAIGNLDQRAGCQKVLEVDQLQQGWARLTEAIARSHSSITTAISDSARVDEVNHLMILLCAGFVIQTAHRCTRLERLTFGALFMHDDAILIADKDEGDRTHPRLIPKTLAVKELLRLAFAVHLLMNPIVADGVHHDTCLFVRWSNEQGHHIEPVTTGDLARVISEFFKAAEYNFGRSAWVTHLDEDGCDRWLIRVLTGHARDVTRTNGAYFDISPLTAACMLAASMERTGHRIFGPTTLFNDQAAPLVFFRANVSARQTTTVSFMVPDPRTLLDPLSVATLAGWRATTRLRHALASGAIQIQPTVLAILHMILMDFVPDLELCISALQKPEKMIRCHGKTAGLLWLREHFVHPTWLPLLPTTTRLLVMSMSDPLPRTRLLDSLSVALRHIDPTYWPSSPEGCSATLVPTARSFLRLEFPPSLLAVSDPGVPAPTLNELSLMRLSKAGSISISTPPSSMPKLWRRNPASNQPDRDLNSLKKIVYANISQTMRLGELRKRALICLDHIRTDVQVESSFCAWVLEWVTDELQQSAQDMKGRLDISSLYTYLGVIARRPRQLADVGMADPYEWSDDEWRLWLETLNSDVSGMQTGISTVNNVKNGTGQTTSLHKRVKDAAGRLVRNLVHRGHWVPAFVRSALAEGDEHLPSGSASACLITDTDITHAIHVARRWLEEKPLDALMLETRARIQYGIPTRSSDISNLRFDCMTQCGTLIIERVGYKNIKNSNSVRALKTPDALRQLINAYRTELTKYIPNASFLFRGDGTPGEGLRDVALINTLSTSLKYITGDLSARPHSNRASVLQNTAWIGWLENASQLLRGEVSPVSFSGWIEECRDWTRLAYSASIAGHNDLRASFGNYLAGWNLVFAVHATSLLSRLDLRPNLLSQLGVDPAGFRKFRQRTPIGIGRCQWKWFFGRITNDSVEQLIALIRPASLPKPAPVARSEESSSPDSALPESTRPPPQCPQQPIAANFPSFKRPSGDGIDLTDVTYLSARILGMPTPQAIQMNDMNFSRASTLDTLMHPDHLISKVSSRARSSPRQRGRQGNLAVLYSDQGNQLLEWVIRLNEHQILIATQFAFRLCSRALPDRHMAEFWFDLLTGMPGFCALKVHRNLRHLGDEERSLLIRNNGPLDLKLDSQIGAIPGFRLVTRDSDNRVLGTRLNSVFRAALLSSAFIRGVLKLDN